MKKIEKPDKKDYREIVDMWEASVRATHYFLTEDDIQFYKPLVLDTFLDLVDLRCIRNENDKIIGFMGVANNNLEMLFIHPNYIGNGIGKMLLDYSVENMNVAKVDVNEQNKQAIGFYIKYGFVVVGRSELDATGKPYPILHLELKNTSK